MTEATADRCDFCSEFEDSTYADSTRIIWSNKDFMLLPTVGCLTPGYCLFMPRKHVYSFAEINSNDGKEVIYYLEKFRSEISNIFGPAIIVEHGSAYCDKGAGCCSHAHMHIIPVRSDKVIDEFEKIGAEAQVLLKYEELNRYSGSPYVFLSPASHLYLVYRADRFYSQFIRIVVSRILGFEWLYNWRKFPFHENMIITQQALSTRLEALSQGNSNN